MQWRFRWFSKVPMQKVWHFMFCWLCIFYNLVKKPTSCTNFLNMFIAFLYMFRATKCPSSGENTVPMRHLVFVTLNRWLSCTADSPLYRVTNTRCHIGTVFSPDDGHIVAWNMQRKAINILRIFVHWVGSIYKGLYKDAQSTKHKKQNYMFLLWLLYNLYFY
jgi:hypothetical protein